MIPDKKFNIEDVIVCIDSSGWADHITEGFTYIVDRYIRYDINRGWLIALLCDDNGIGYTAYEDRFEKKVQ